MIIFEKHATMKKLIRKEGKLFGVCEGLAEYTGIDANVIRIVFALSSIYYGVGIIPYIVLTILTPKH